MKFLFRNFEANQRFSGHIFFIIFLSSLGINNFLINCVAITFYTCLKLFMENICPSLILHFTPIILKKQSKQRILNFGHWIILWITSLQQSKNPQGSSSGNWECFPGLHLAWHPWIKRRVWTVSLSPCAAISPGEKQTKTKKPTEQTKS